MDDVRYFNVVLSRFVKGGSDHFRVDATCHIRYLLRTLVDKEDDHIYFGMVGGDSIGNLLEQYGLTSLRLCHDQSALTFANRAEEVNDTNGKRIIMTGAEFEFLIREEWGKVLKGDTSFDYFGIEAIDTDHFLHGEIFLTIAVGT